MTHFLEVLMLSLLENLPENLEGILDILPKTGSNNQLQHIMLAVRRRLILLKEHVFKALQIKIPGQVCVLAKHTSVSL